MVDKRFQVINHNSSKDMHFRELNVNLKGRTLTAYIIEPDAF